MSVIREFVILEDRQKNLETTIDFLLNCKKYSWDKIYLFSAFVSDDGVKKVKKILEHPYLDENTEVVIAIGTKNYFNDPSDIQDLLKFIKESTKIKASVRFICPKNNFHIKAYCFLGRHLIDDNKEIVDDNKEIGFSIIGSSNLTWRGLECEGELCISIHNLNLTKDLISRLSNKYIDDRDDWDKKIKNYKIEYDEKRQEKKYKDKQSRQDQDEVEPLADRPKDGRSIEWIGGFVSPIIDAEGKNLIVQSRESELDFLYYSSKNIYEMEKLYPVDSLCHLAHSNDVQESWNKGIKREIIKIKDHKYYSEGEHNGCFLLFQIKLSYNVCDDILDIAKQKKYEEIFNVSDESILPYDTLKTFQEEVKKYQEMVKDPNYQTGLKKGEKKMQKMQSEIEILLEKIEEIDLITLKKKLKEIRESI